MANKLPPVKASGYAFEVSLVSQTDTDIWQTPVTLAAGDVLVSKNGSKGWANITTLPTEPGTKGVLSVTLSTSEMNADRIAVLFHDDSGGQWQDALITIFTAEKTFNDLPTGTQVADAVWDELTAGHTAAGSFGGKVSLITSTSITVASPVASGGDVTTYKGDSYKVADGRQIEWGVSSSATLTGGTVKILLDGVETFTGSVQSEILVRCSDITGTQSNAIAEGPHGLQVRVIQPDGDRITVVRANWTSLDPYNL